MTSVPTHVTLSLGGTSLGSAIVEAELLISCADQALYQAKRNGRNQVRLWTDPSGGPEPTEAPTSEPPHAPAPKRRSA